MAPLFISKMAD